MATDAPTPSRSALLQFARDLKRKPEADKKLDTDDLQIAEMADMPGWKLIEQKIESMKRDLKPNFEFKGSDDDFFKSYGMRSVIYDIVSDQLNEVLRRVENARDIVRETRDTAV